MNKIATPKDLCETLDRSAAGEDILFPLAVTPFEWLFLIDDSAAYPMTFLLSLLFKGKFIEDLFRRAWQLVLTRHPLLQANVLQASAGRPCWVAAADTEVPLVFTRDATPGNISVGQRIDLSKEIGVRIRVSEGAETTQVWLSVHHACCDGIAGLRLVEEFLSAYSQLYADHTATIQLRPLRSELLVTRQSTLPERPASISAEPTSKPASEAPRNAPAAVAHTRPPELTFGARIWLAARFLLRRPRPLAISGARHSIGNACAESCSSALSGSLLQALRHHAAQQNASLNDLLIRDLFMTIDDWNRGQARYSAQSWLRLNMPTNLRNRSHEQAPAMNLFSYSFIDRRGTDCVDPAGLLTGIAWESDAIRKGNLSFQFLLGLSWSARWPRFFRWSIRLPRCAATAVITYLGDPTRRFVTRFPREDGKIVAGNVRLEQITGSPPIRKGTRLGLSANTYAGVLTLGLRYDACWLTLAEARSFMDSYTKRLAATAANMEPWK